MKRIYSIKKTEDIDQIFKARKSVGNNFFAVYYANHQLAHFKYAISIGRKYGGAVERNLAKRRIRATILGFKERLKNEYGFVIVVKPSAKDLKYLDILKSLEKLLNKANLLEKEDAENA